MVLGSTGVMQEEREYRYTTNYINLTNMQKLIELLQKLAKEHNDRQVIRHSIGLAKRLQELNTHNKEQNYQFKIV